MTMLRRSFLLGSSSLALSSHAMAQAFLGSSAAGISVPTSVQLIGSSIVDNAAAGTVVGTFQTTGGVPPDTYSGWTNAKFQISGSNLVRSSTGVLTAGTPETGNVTTTDSIGNSTNTATNGQGPFTITVTAHTGQITSFNLVNFSASNSKCRYRRGLWFAKGDVPTGSIPVISGGVTPTYQFDERNFWSDGSLKVCVLSMIDTDFVSGVAGETRTYTVTTTTGSYNNTGLRTLADITGSTQFQVTFAATTQYDGTTTTARGSGAFLADFNTQAAVATRVYNYHSGPVCSSWEVWGMATDVVGGAADPHLKTIWYVTAWNNANGTLNDIEYGAVVTQDWWGFTVAATKYRLNYNAVLQNLTLGSPVITTYNTVQHSYQGQWMTVFTGNTDNHARRFWLNAMPTIYHTFDKNYARSTGLFGYLDPTFVPTSNATNGYTSNYTPCSAQNHRAAVNGTGAYMGRGLMPVTDCAAWMRQTSNDYRYARTNGFAGLHIPYHYKSDALRTISSGPQAGTDTANTVISLKMLPLSAPSYDFTAQGMPAAQDAYVSGGSGVIATNYVAKSGFSGVWSDSGAPVNNPSGDASHAVAYSYGMYLLEGERHFMQATLDLATNCVHQQHGNTFGGAPQASYISIAPFQALFSIPSTQYSGIAGQWPERGNLRNVGWSMMCVAYADGVCPDADVQAGFISLLRSQQPVFSNFNATYMPATQLALGLYGLMQGSQVGFVNSPWMSNFQILGHAANAIINEDTGSQALVNNVLQYAAIAPWQSGTQYYRSQDYRELTLLKTQTNWDLATNPFLPLSGVLQQSSCTVTSNVLTLTNAPEVPITNGDVIYFVRTDSSFNAIAIPVGLSEATPYYTISSSGLTCQLSLTPGGAAITVPNGTYSAGLQPAQWNNTPAANPPATVNYDDYPCISNAALVMASKVSGTSVTSTHLSRASSFLSTVNQAPYCAWVMLA